MTMDTIKMTPHYDALIVGARVAGAATAMLLARAGLRVLVVDRGRSGSDTTSTHALMRAGVVQLQRWDLLDRLWETGAAPIHRTTFHYGERVIGLDISDKFGVDTLVAPRRNVFDAMLVDAAREAGAIVEHGVTVRSLEQNADGRVVGATLDRGGERTRYVSAGIVIGADGARSTVARLVGAPTLRQGFHATGSIYRYVTGLANDGYHWYYDHGLGAGVIPTHEGASCIFVGGASARVQHELKAGADVAFDRLLAEAAPELARVVAESPTVGKTRGWGGLPGHVRQSTGPGWALVGDAAYFKDPLTAHGMTDALRDAELLADAVTRGSPAAFAGYVGIRNALSSQFFDLTDAVASCQWNLAELGELHLALNREMNRESEYLARRGPWARRLANAS